MAVMEIVEGFGTIVAERRRSGGGRGGALLVALFCGGKVGVA